MIATKNNNRYLMNMHTPLQVLRLLFTGGVVLLLFSCGTDEVPDIYVDQRMETVDDDGNNIIRQRYLDAVGICEDAGKKVSGLSKKEIDLLGTRRYRLSIHKDKIVQRVESWGFGMTGHYVNPGECRFELTFEGNLTVRTPGRTVVYDLKDGVISEDEAGIPEAFRLFFEPVPVPKSLQDSLETMSSEEDILLGQPVLRWTRTDGSRETIWSAGTQWGFWEVPTENMFASTESIVLEAERKRSFYTMRITTQQFTVGAPLPNLEDGLPAAVQGKDEVPHGKTDTP
ncbi:hypothetical protein [Sinomicrobium soli]|uniref:hypothetical protein n=1 Tax=Sinomicrobium sp. N-1-3-6 TaxID=2219864 RepID=UPI0011BD60A4|nr:hypothetical protein [Sinomicrobium sp. N-1-3-6]